MAEIPLDPSIAQLSPNLATALSKANLPASQKLMVEQMSQSYTKGKSLLKINEEKARKDFLDLDPIVQNNIRYLYPNQKRFEAEQNLLGQVVKNTANFVGGAMSKLVSPLTLGWKAAEISGKVANTVGEVYQATVYQDKPFTKKVLSDAYNGKNMWRWDDVAKYEEKYGKAMTTLARGVAEYRTPGESIDMYGKFDDKMMLAIKYMGDNPKKFDDIVNEIKQFAQLSPGRNIAQPRGNLNPNPNSWAVKLTQKLGMDVTKPEGQVKASKFVSGPVDAVYQLLNPTDPLNLIGIGPIIKTTTKGIGGIRVGLAEAVKFGGFKSRGEKLAEQYQFIAERTGGAAGIKEATRFAFSEPDVAKLWNNQLGPVIQKYASAAPGAERSNVYREIKSNFPEWANESFIRELAKAETFNAPAAQKFFQMYENGTKLLNLNVDGADFYRNGIPVARRSRQLTSYIQRTINDTFFGKVEDKAALAKIDTTAKDAIDKLKKVADKEDNLLSPLLTEINKLNKETETAKSRAGRMASRTPGRILYGPDAIKTIDNVRNLIHVVGFPRHVADAMADLYVDEPIEYQITFIRNLYAAYYKRIGIGGKTNGNAHMAELLNSTFNEKAGMFSMARTEIPQGWEQSMSRAIYRYDNDVPVLSTRGIVHPAQVTEGISPIPFDLALQHAAMDKLSHGLTLPNLIGGATRNHLAAKSTDVWSNLTLVPRLGVRSAVDETLFYGLNAPFYDLLELAVANVSTTGAQIKGATAITGSKAGIGLYKRGLYKAMPWLDPTKKIPTEVRKEMIQKLATDNDVPVGNVLHAEIINSLSKRAEEIYGKTLPKEAWDAVRLVMKHNPHMLDAMAQSVGAKASMSGKIDEAYLDSTFTPGAWTNFYKELGLEKSKIFTPREVAKMKDKEIAAAHYDNWQLRFGFNGAKVAPGVYINPTPYFLSNNALRTEKDFITARNTLLEQLKVKYDDTTGLFVTRGDKNYASEFISPFGITVYYRQQGMTDIEIARAIIENMLIDMKTTFHGSPNGFNEDLYKLITKKHREIQRAAEAKNQLPFDTWSKAVEVTEFKEFENATVGFRPTSGEINTRLVNVGGDKDLSVFNEFSGIGGMLDNFQNWSMEVMDAQVTGLYRQKMLWITMTKNLKDLKPFQANIAEDIFQKTMAEMPNKGFTFETRMRENAAALAEKQVVELAWSDATNTLLKYVDNPAIRSNLATSIRSVGRFYRSTEDFYRRIYRLYTKQPLRTLYRMRLLHQGLAANGDVYTDNKGDQYIVFPTDAIINNVIEPLVNTLPGVDNFKVPTFNDMAIKFRLINPSFSPDAGQPSLSGPIAAVSMLAVKGLLRELPMLPPSLRDKLYPWTNKAADEIDTLALGNIGANLNLYKALTPLFAQNVINTLPGVDMDRQKVTAAMQAASYLEAYGNGAPKKSNYVNRETEYIADYNKYLQNLKLAAASVLVMRTILGQVSPGMPTMKETASLPESLKRAGIASPTGEFWDIYNSILRNEGSDIGNAWDLAVASFIGKNPGKLAFITPRNEKEYKIFINKTNEVKDWAVNNKPFINKYNESAWLFAPKVGEYNPDIYGWMQSQGLVKLPTLESYLYQVQLAVDRQAYFGIKDDENEQLKKTFDIDRRKEIMAKAQVAQNVLRISNPDLAAELEGSVEGKGELDKKFFNLVAAVNDPKAPISKQLRGTMQFIINEVKNFKNFANDYDMRSQYDYSGVKAAEKNKVQASIDELSKSVPEIKEAARLILTPLLDTYSKNILTAGPKG